MNSTIMTIKDRAMAALVLATSLLAPALATAQVEAISLIEPLEVIVESDCTGEAILIEGFDHLVITDPFATGKMASERPGHTLQATALVHEAFVRLGGSHGCGFENQAHFFSAAAEAMRRILKLNPSRPVEFPEH